MISGTNGARQDGDERYGQAGTRHTSRKDSAIKRSLRQVSTLEDTVSTVHCLQEYQLNTRFEMYIFGLIVHREILFLQASFLRSNFTKHSSFYNENFPPFFKC